MSVMKQSTATPDYTNTCAHCSRLDRWSTSLLLLIITTTPSYMIGEILLQNKTNPVDTSSNEYNNTISAKLSTIQTVESENTTDMYNVASLIFTRFKTDGFEANEKHTEKLNLPAGQWAVWSSWFCSVPCGAAGFFIRTRNCHWLHDNSSRCVGKAFQQTGVCNTSHLKCPYDCSSGSWGVGCGNRCSSSCLGRKCDNRTGVCFSCRAHYFGDYCEFQCFKGSYGSKCEKTCGFLCFNGCNLETGRCLKDTTIFLAVVAIMIIASYLPAILAYFAYFRAFDLTSPMRKVDRMTTAARNQFRAFDRTLY